MSGPGMKSTAVLAVPRAQGRSLVLAQQVGAAEFARRRVGQIDQHGESFDADIGMRLEPEAADILAIFDAQNAVIE